MRLPEGDAALAAFEAERRRLTGLAYRMLGSLAEAEDAVQDAWLRWQAAERGAVAEPRAFLSRTVARLCLDRLKSARARRETYVGPWLPEPLHETDTTAVEMDGPEGADVTVTLMLALERLSPLERAAFLLHDVFDLDFAEVARALDRSEAACRQLAARARAHVRAARPRFPVSPAEGERVAAAFLHASRSGDTRGLQALLAEDAVLRTDGGGRRPSALNPIFGAARIARFFAGVARKAGGASPPRVLVGRFNGMPGFLTLEADGLPQVTMLALDEGRIAAVHVVRNPEKLARLARLIGAGDASG